MWFAHKALRVALSLALVATVTAVLWRIQMTMGGSHQFIYFYLFPVIWIRMLYSDALAAFSAVVASVLANYFLQYPLYSLSIDNPLEYGDHVCFVVLALLAIKCVFSEPLMPPQKKTRRDDRAVGRDPSIGEHTAALGTDAVGESAPVFPEILNRSGAIKRP